MNPNATPDPADAESLLQRQRPPTPSECVPPMPHDLRRQWDEHFGSPSRTSAKPTFIWIASLAAAAALVLAFVNFDRPRTPGPQPPPPDPLLALDYQDPRFAGLYEPDWEPRFPGGVVTRDEGR